MGHIRQQDTFHQCKTTPVPKLHDGERGNRGGMLEFGGSVKNGIKCGVWQGTCNECRIQQ